MREFLDDYFQFDDDDDDDDVAFPLKTDTAMMTMMSLSSTGAKEQ